MFVAGEMFGHRVSGAPAASVRGRLAVAGPATKRWDSPAAAETAKAGGGEIDTGTTSGRNGRKNG